MGFGISSYSVTLNGTLHSKANLFSSLLLSLSMQSGFKLTACVESRGHGWHLHLSWTNWPCVVNVLSVNQAWPSVKREPLLTPCFSSTIGERQMLLSSLVFSKPKVNTTQWRSQRCQGWHGWVGDIMCIPFKARWKCWVTFIIHSNVEINVCNTWTQRGRVTNTETFGWLWWVLIATLKYHFYSVDHI